MRRQLLPKGGRINSSSWEVLEGAAEKTQLPLKTGTSAFASRQNCLYLRLPRAELIGSNRLDKEKTGWQERREVGHFLILEWWEIPLDCQDPREVATKLQSAPNS